MLGKVLSMVITSGANNPWKPTSQEQFNEMVADKDKLGNYIEYAGKTYRVEAEKLVGDFKVGSEITKLYFDTTKTPSKSFSDSDFDVVGLMVEADLSGNKYSAKIKYLAVSDETKTFVDGEGKSFNIRKGLSLVVCSNGYRVFWIYGYDNDEMFYASYPSGGWQKTILGENNSYTLNNPFVPTYVASQASAQFWSSTNAGYVFTKIAPQSTQTYYPLVNLSNAATSIDIKRDKKAYNSSGVLIIGTHDEPQNPWAPETEAEYNALMVPAHIGNFFNYGNKITRLEGISYSGTFAVGDSITGAYFDTTKTPTIPDFTSGYETVGDIKVKYLFKTAAASEEEGFSHYGLLWYEAVDGGDTIHILTYLAANGDGPLVYTDVALGGDAPEPGWVADGFTLSVAETITEVEPNYDWNGVYAFKNREAQIDEYIKVVN